GRAAVLRVGLADARDQENRRAAAGVHHRVPAALGGAPRDRDRAAVVAYEVRSQAMIDHVGNFLGKGGRAAIVRRNALWAVGMIVGFALACTATLLVRPGALTYVLGFPA